jgi:hypothetical protein
MPRYDIIAVKHLSRMADGNSVTPANPARQKLPSFAFVISSHGLAASPALPPRSRCNMMGGR